MGLNSMKRAACTIVSLNYLPFARALCESFLRFHPDWKFYVLLVDRLPEDLDFHDESFELVLVENLGIKHFESIAFKYDILELNTNVKPTLLQTLLDRGMDEVVYLDPDIYVYRELAPVISALAKEAIVLIPHAVSPTPDQGQSDLNLLSCGVFNLGFIAVRNCSETRRFLSWWEERCLSLAFDDRRDAMFVDQKWVNLVPCFFNSVTILKHQGCNLAYWNLHERRLSDEADTLMVNGVDPLIFFHFSGISVDGGEQVSKNSDKFTLSNRPDLRCLFEGYREQLLHYGLRDFSGREYAFGVFDNGQPINRLTRRLYSVNLERFAGENPFRSTSGFYLWAKDKGLLGRSFSPKVQPFIRYSKTGAQARILGAALRLTLHLLGPERYLQFMKYLSYISILRNQWVLF
jgi:hypothetical protein